MFPAICNGFPFPTLRDTLQGKLHRETRPGIPKNVLRLINIRTNEMFYVLDKGDPDLDFDVLFSSFGLK